jgi:hypothetical protein
MMKLCDFGRVDGISRRIPYSYEQFEISVGNRGEKGGVAGGTLPAGPRCDVRLAPSSDTGVDFIVAFPNGQGGTNLSAVEVKGTDRPVGDAYPLDSKWYKRLAHSNVPSLLLVVDAKHNLLYHAWPKEDISPGPGARMIRVPITLIDDSAKEQIRERLSGADISAASRRRR